MTSFSPPPTHLTPLTLTEPSLELWCLLMSVRLVGAVLTAPLFGKHLA